MPRFRVNIAPGVSQIMDAQTEDEARKKVRAEIAKGAVSPFYDELYFDYETGVNLQDLRQKLGRAEKMTEENEVLDQLFSKVKKSKSPSEQEDIMENAVGTAGYVRNTKGQIALTPYGLELLGQPVQQRRLQDGSTINLNTIIDENSFNLKTGDAADLSGIAGPVASTVLAFMPQTKILKAFTSLFGGRKPLANTFVAGGASAIGKGGEEYLDTLEGFQLQDRDELIDLGMEEFIIGSVGQGVFGELPAKVYRMFLGKRAPIENQRIVYQLSKNRSWDDVQKLDESLGREATEKEIKKAMKKGQVKKFDYAFARGAIPSQTTLGRMLPGKYQQFAEQVIGNNRDVANAAVLRAELDYILSGIKKERAALNSYMSESSKEGLDESVNAALQKLRLDEQDVTTALQKLLKDIGADVLEVSNYGNVPSRFAFGETLKDTLSSARGAVTKASGQRYRAVDQKFLDIASPDNVTIDNRGNPVFTGPKTETEANKARIINKAINGVILKHVRVAQDLVASYKDSGNFWKLKQPGQEISGGLVEQLDGILANMSRRAKEAVDGDAPGINLQEIRNDISNIRDFTTEVIGSSHERKLLTDVMRTLDDYNMKNGVSLKNGDSILTELAQDGNKVISLALADSGYRLMPKDVKVIKRAVDDLRKANKLHFERMQPFDSIEMDKLISNARKGSINADKVYSEAILKGSNTQLNNIFKGLREYDEYLEKTGKTKLNKAGEKITTENSLKAQLKNRLFADAFQSATKDGLTDVDFTQFARSMLKFDMENAGKFDSLFTNSATGQQSGESVLQTINQLNMIKPNLKPQALKNLVNNFTVKNASQGLNAEKQGRAFIEGLTDLAKASEERARFEANRAISQLPQAGVEETVNKIFRPGSAENIRLLKETLKDTPEVFNSIQQASMQKLLAKSIDFNGKGKITDLFKHQNLKTALDTYGDETLEAMFGRDIAKGLRNFQKEVDVLTIGESGRSGGAGGLIAAGIAASIVFNPLSTLPILTSLALVRALFTNRTFVSLMSKTDQGSIAQAIKLFNTAARQAGLRYVDGELVPFAEGANTLLEKGLGIGATAIGITGDDVKGQADQGLNMFQQLRNQVTAPIKQLPQLPNVQPTQTPTDPMSQERLDFAEQVAGRPVI